MRYVELFAGAGGLSMGLEAAGMVPVAHAEIEPHARAVLRHHWPDTPLHGDVTQVDWTQYAGRVNLVAGGSPCQDLSVAGKRAGLAGARSGLFYELIRAWDETGATYCLWENVDGARSSNKGADLASVLSAFVGGSVAVPRDGWRRAGVVAGSTGVAAWRVLDLQHFGPPQRRRRIFVLAARTGGVDPAEVLALSEGVCGHPSPRQQQRQGAARGAAGGAGDGGIIPIGAVLTFKAGQSEAAGGTFVTEGFTPTLQGGSNGSTQVPAVLAFEPRYYLRDNKTGGAPSDVVKVDASIGKNGDAVPHVLALGGEVVPPLVARHSRGHAQSNSPSHTTDGQTVVQPHVLAFHSTQTPISGIVSPAIGRTTDGMGVICTTGHITHALTHKGADAGEDGTGRGTPIVAYGRSSFGEWDGAEVIAPVCSRDAKDASSLVLDQQLANGSEVAATLTVAYADKHGLEDQHVNSGCPLFVLSGGQANASVNKNISPTLDVTSEQPIAFNPRPRRLTPKECERLMGWPDQHTAHGVKEDGTAYALSDTARYRLCGNGVGTPVAAWIASRLMAEEVACPTP